MRGVLMIAASALMSVGAMMSETQREPRSAPQVSQPVAPQVVQVPQTIAQVSTQGDELQTLRLRVQELERVNADLRRRLADAQSRHVDPPPAPAQTPAQALVKEVYQAPAYQYQTQTFATGLRGRVQQRRSSGGGLFRGRLLGACRSGACG